MKKIMNLSVVLVVSALTISSAVAAPAKKAAPAKPSAPAASSSGGYSSSSPWAEGSGAMEMNVSGPFTFIEGDIYWGAYFNLLFRTFRDVSIGGETGFLLRSANSVTLWSIPLAFKGVYHFDLGGSAAVSPFAGASIGFNIFHVPNNTSLKFHGILSGGVAFGEDRNLFGELRLGSMAGGFAIGPNFGVRF